MSCKSILKILRSDGRIRVFIFLMLLFFSVEIPIRAAAGDLDPTFGGSGALKLSNPQNIGKILVQPDGKILTSGSTRTGGTIENPLYAGYLVRFTANGGL